MEIRRHISTPYPLVVVNLLLVISGCVPVVSTSLYLRSWATNIDRTRVRAHTLLEDGW